MMVTYYFELLLLFLTLKLVNKDEHVLNDIRLWNHARIRSWNQPVLSNNGKVSCSRKQRGPLMGFEPMTSTLRVRHVTYCIAPSLKECPYQGRGSEFKDANDLTLK